MTISIEEFYKSNLLDQNFNEKLYTQQYPETIDFYQPYCKEHNIDDKYRLYYHYVLYKKHIILSKETSVKQNNNNIYIKVTNGLSNRLRTLNSFYSFAKKNNKKLYVCWESGPGFSNEHFLDLFEPIEDIEFIDYREYYSKDHIRLDQFVKKNENNPDKYVFLKSIGYLINQINNCDFSYEGNSCLEYMLPSFFQNNVNLYSKLKPQKNIQKLIDDVQIKINEHTLGVHIRRGDAWNSPWSDKYCVSDDDSFFAEIDYQIKNNDKTNIFLSTDCKKTQNLFRNKYKDLIIVNEKKIFVESTDHTKEKLNQKDAVIDLFLLSNTKKIIGSNWSSFSQISSEINNIPLIVAKNSSTKILSINNNIKNVSIVCASMNRTNALKVSLNSWLLNEKFKEIIIVDWSSAENLKNLEKLDNRIKVVIIPDKKYFDISKAYNIGIKNCSQEWILKMDVDYILNPYYDIFEEYLNHIQDDEILTGSYNDSLLDNKLGFLEYLNGLIFLKKEAFNDINGYNENFQGYGFDDEDLYLRLNQKYKRLFLDQNKKIVFHVPHEDNKRYENYEDKDIKKSLLKNIEKSEVL